MTKREYRYHSRAKYKKFLAALYRWVGKNPVKDSPLTKIWVSPMTVIYATKEDGEDKWKWEVPLPDNFPHITEIITNDKEITQ